jgi:hypothetical protein
MFNVKLWLFVIMLHAFFTNQTEKNSKVLFKSFVVYWKTIAFRRDSMGNAICVLYKSVGVFSISVNSNRKTNMV